jgi:ribosomal protein L15E
MAVRRITAVAEYQVADVDLHAIDTDSELEGIPSSVNHRSEIRSIKAFCAKSIGLSTYRKAVLHFCRTLP